MTHVIDLLIFCVCNWFYMHITLQNICGTGYRFPCVHCLHLQKIILSSVKKYVLVMTVIFNV